MESRLALFRTPATVICSANDIFVFTCGIAVFLRQTIEDISVHYIIQII